MMNDEGICDASDENCYWQGQRLDCLDASTVSSRYSSCGESELERYCSANSVMGTPSLCSSVGTFPESFDTDLFSMRNFALGEDGVSENFILGGSLDRKSEPKRFVLSSGSECLSNKRIEFYKGESDAEHGTSVNIGQKSNFYDNEESPSSLLPASATSSDMTSVNLVNEPELLKDAGLHAASDLTLQSSFHSDGKEMERCSEEDGSSSRYEHSDGDNSMFEYGIDDPQKMSCYYRRSQGEKEDKNENRLLINSSIAFGSEDWDDFVQERGENTLNFMNLDDLYEQKQQTSGPESYPSGSASVNSVSLSSWPKHTENFTDIRVASNKAHGSEGATYEKEKDMVLKEVPPKESSNSGMEKEHQLTNTKELISFDESQLSNSQEMSKIQINPFCDIPINKFCCFPVEEAEDKKVELIEEHKPKLPSTTEHSTRIPLKDSRGSLLDGHPAPIERENLELNEFYDELVLEMEEILLDSVESPALRLTESNTKKSIQSQLSLPLRDGGSTASTSATDDNYSLVRDAFTIDEVEVIGAKQKRGDVSLGERLVGVKEYTVYVIRVRSDSEQWEVERRYRDFCTLYNKLKTTFTDKGLILPSPWSSVDKESRKIFGNSSPDVILERSSLIQECLRSVIHSEISANPPSALIWFLSPPKDFTNSSCSLDYKNPDEENVSTLGKTMSLVVEIRAHKSVKQLLEAQHYHCAGCHRHFNDGKTRMSELVQTFGWGKPRLCEYTGQLFCSSCHTNETAVLPAKVLHHWDFTHYPVSQMAKSFLESIHDQPMLCVSAVNPFLLSKVPALLHVMGVRKRIKTMIQYVHCPFRRSIYNGLGTRRYLVESNDFFALRDLIDLSKGAFAALPVMVETVSRKIQEHITEQCLICCDVGVPCGARQSCDDPSSLIFPFQEEEIERCKACKSVFHKACFKKIKACPCKMDYNIDEAVGPFYNKPGHVRDEVEGTLDLLHRNLDSRSAVGFLSGFFSKGRQENTSWSKDNDNVILMGSLPSTSLW